MIYLKMVFRKVVGCFFRMLQKYFSLLNRVLFFLSVFFLSNVAFATEIIAVNDESVQEHLPQIMETNFGMSQVNIVNSKYGISYNKIEKFSVGTKGVVINNSDSPKAVEGRGVVGSNDNLIQPANIIVLEVTGACSSELQGPITVVGSKAKVILSNPNGITCNGCEFINSNEVIIRTDKPRLKEYGLVEWEKDLYGEINIGSTEGITVSDGSLVLSAGKIKMEGGVFSKGKLHVEAHFVMDDREKNSSEIKNEEMQYTIDIADPAKITAEEIYLIALGMGGIRISNPFLSDEGVGRKPVELKANKNKVYVEAKNGDFDVGVETIIEGDFKFVGKNFKNKDKLKADSIELNLSKRFINDKDGEITIADRFHVKSDHFINDNGGYIGAGSIKVYLTGKMEDTTDENKNGKSLYQGSNSVLESREGSLELVAPEGGMYFGYKKEITGAGDDKDGFIFVGSKLLCSKGEIHIQSGGDVVFDGTQIQGNIKVEAKGKIRENKASGSYKNGTFEEIKKENAERIVEKSVTKTKQVFDHAESWCKVFGLFGKCVGGWGHKEHYRTESYVEIVPTKETYVKETTHQSQNFQTVELMANIDGSKLLFSNNEELVFNKESSFLNEEDNINYLSFVSYSDKFFEITKSFNQENERYFFENIYQKN